MQQTKDIDLGGGWAATIRRPPFWVRAELLIPDASTNGGGDLAAAQIGAERGGDEPQAESDPPSPPPPPPMTHEEKVKHIRWLEEELIPNSVVSFRDPAGNMLKETPVGDLGQIRFSLLVKEIIDFIAEADAWFLTVPGAVEAGAGV